MNSITQWVRRWLGLENTLGYWRLYVALSDGEWTWVGAYASRKDAERACRPRKNQPTTRVEFQRYKKRG